MSQGTYTVKKFILDGFELSGGAAGSPAFGYSISGSVPTFDYWILKNGTIGDFGVQLANLSDANSKVIISNVDFISPTWSSGAVPLRIQGSKNVTLQNLNFTNNPSEYCIFSEGTEGRASGITFNNVSAGRQVYAGGSAGMGVHKPTWTGNVGDWIQNLNQANEIGAVGTEYVLTGWQYDGSTTWVETRLPTENNSSTA